MKNSDNFYQLVEDIRGHRCTMVETGTAVGETALWASKVFDEVITVEYMDDLYRSCFERFWEESNIKLIHGDSAEWIDLIVHNVEEDAVWFLDAHDVNRSDGLLPPEETPVYKEILAICKAVYSHIILVDDLRLFGTGGYPSIEEIVELCATWSCIVDIVEDQDLFIVRRS